VAFTVVADAGSRRFSLHGELDVAEADGLVEAIKAHGRGDGDLTLDLTALEFIDSSGVRALVSITGLLAEGSTLVLIAPTPTVRRIFDLVGLDKAGSSILVERSEG
jgi:anti-sigma B factor antagonist